MKKHIERMVKSYAEDDVLEDTVLDVAVYVRVSTSGQTTENQIIELSEICDRNKWNIVKVYNETVSGTKSITERPILKEMLDDASRKRFQMVVVWSVDRVGRSLKHLVSVMTHLDELGCYIYSFKQGIQTNTSMGSMFFSLMGVMAQMETDIRKERQTIGIKRALSQGVKFGRRKVVDTDTELEIVEMRHNGKTLRYIAKKTGISLGSVQKVCSTKSSEKTLVTTH